MDVTFRGHHTSVPELVREVAQKKLQRMERYLPAAAQAVVEVNREEFKAAERYAVQITLNCDGTYLRAQERAPNLNLALDTVLDKLSRQVDRYSEKRRQRRHLAGRIDAAATSTIQEPAEEEEVGPLGKVGRVKRFEVKPMTVEEAVEQMELLAHDFFLFYDVDDHQYAVLYRRSQGDYGLIIPEPA